jgi:hypothetical protein
MHSHPLRLSLADEIAFIPFVLSLPVLSRVEGSKYDAFTRRQSSGRTDQVKRF